MQGYVVVEGVCRIAGVVVVVADQRERVGVTGGHGRVHLLPRSGVAACLGQHGRGRTRGDVGQGRGRPVIRHRVRADHLGVERQTGGSRGCGERLCERRVTIGRGRAPDLRGVGPTVPNGDHAVRRPRLRPPGQVTGLIPPVADARSWRRGAANRHVVVEGVCRIAGVVVVVADQRERVGVTGGHGRVHLLPRSGVAACLGQHGRGRTRGDVGQGRGRPVIRHRVRADHLGVERQTGGSRGCGERLCERRVTIGRGRAPDLRGVGPTVPNGDHAVRRPRLRPPGQVTGLIPPVADAR